jgi:uncharacterized protein
MSTSQQLTVYSFNKIKAKYLFLWLILFNLGFAGLYGTLATFVPILPHSDDPIVSHILYSCSFLSLSYYLLDKLRRSEIKPQYLVGKLAPRYPWWSLLRLVVFILLFSIGIALVSFYCLSWIAPNFLETLMESVSKEESQASSIPIIYRCWDAINCIVIAPITEEFIFRGVLLHRLATKWNIATAVWVSSIIFGLLHFNPLGISMAGIAWALLYLKTRTLIIPIVAHAMNNTIAVMVELLSDVMLKNNLVESTTDPTSSSSLIIGLLLSVVSFPFLLRFIYQRFPGKNQSLPYFANEAKAIALTSLD